ncbi:MAG TPA: VWA domain-containing protein [Candidatus Solibacter sp.]|nr:VWA domain-containing protein [Candidatus Solibacter sp.]
MRKSIVVILAALTAVGQQQPQPPAQPAAQPALGGRPTFSSTTSLVVVDVTVKDKSGKLVEGLSEKDFALLEDGKPQKISVFEFEKLATDPAPAEKPPTLEDADIDRPAPVKMITTEEPGKIQYHDKRLLVFFFDLGSMGIPEQLRAQDSALQFLDKQITTADMVAIMMYTATLQVLTDFTDNRDQLRDIVKNLPIGEMAELAGMADDGSDDNEDTGAAFVADETEFNIFNTDRKLQAIEDAAKKLSALPEKKAMIYFSSGLQKTGVENHAQVEATILAATKANVAIYPIDARGMMADPPGGGASKGASRGTGIYSGSQHNSQRAAINNSQETLVSLAADTGGKPFLDSNDLSLGIKQAQQDYRSYYVLGYYTTNTAQDGKYRRITVRLNNDRTAKLEHRDGYYADKVWGKFNAQDKEQKLMEALNANNPLTELPLALEVDYFRVTPTSYYVPVSVKVPGSVLGLAQKHGGAGETQFDFLGQIQDERRNVLGNVRDFIKIKLDSASAEKLARRSIHYDAGFTLGPGRYRMKFLVRETLTGHMGTFEARFVVPDLAADSVMLKTSSVIWSSQREPVKTVVGAAERMTRKAQAANPLIVGDEKVVPAVTKVFRRSQNMYVAFDVYDAVPDPANAKARKIAVSMSLFNQKGAKAFEVNAVEATELATTRPNTVPVQLSVPLKGLAPGRYTCQLNVVDEVGRKFAFSRTPLMVQ